MVEDSDPVSALEFSFIITTLSGLVFWFILPTLAASLLRDDRTILGETRRRTSPKIPGFVRAFLVCVGCLTVFVFSFLTIELHTSAFASALSSCLFGLLVVSLSTYLMGMKQCKIFIYNQRKRLHSLATLREIRTRQS